MNAVNLIPADSRRRYGTVSTSRQTLALFAGLVLILVAAVLYVSVANDVTARTTELGRVTASANSWKSAAASYGPIVQTSQQRNQELADVRQLAAARFPWEDLLSEVGNVLPTNASLNSLAATAASASSAAGATASTTASGTGAPLPSVQLTGCAASQSAVAAAMVALHRVHGVTAVTLSTSSGGGSGGPGGGGGCPFPVQFQLSLTFGPAALSGDTAGTGKPAAASSSMPSTTSSGGATASASAPTSSTGAQAQ
jgi:Tfp pilus assembly protein PilN